MSNIDFIKSLIPTYIPYYCYAECGVYRGVTFFQVYDYLKYRFDSFRCYAVDSFSGFPDIVVEVDGEGRHLEQDYWSTYESQFYSMCEERPNIRIIKTEFSDLETNMPDLWYDLVFLDCDLYNSYLDCINFFHNKTDLFVLDEYYSKKYQGAKVAVDEWMLENPGWELFCEKEEDPYWERWAMRRKK
jgi:hypothetical protein